MASVPNTPALFSVFQLISVMLFCRWFCFFHVFPYLLLHLKDSLVAFKELLQSVPTVNCIFQHFLFQFSFKVQIFFSVFPFLFILLRVPLEQRNLLSYNLFSWLMRLRSSHLYLLEFQSYGEFYVFNSYHKFRFLYVSHLFAQQMITCFFFYLFKANVLHLVVIRVMVSFLSLNRLH